MAGEVRGGCRDRVSKYCELEVPGEFGGYCAGILRRPFFERVVQMTAALRVSSSRRFAGGLRDFARSSRGTAVALGVLVVLGIIVCAAPLIAPYDPNAQVLSDRFSGPSATYWLGTDEVGRDVFSRLIFATRVSIFAGLQALVISLLLGVFPGLVAGYLGGRVDRIIGIINDTVMAFPPLILALAIVGVLGPSLTTSMLAIGIVWAPRFLRLVRSSTLSVRREAYIEASQTLGIPTSKIITRHVLPNVAGPLLVQSALAAGFAIVAEAGLSFLGLGVQPPTASWGSMLQRGYRYSSTTPWLIVPPAVAISITVWAVSRLADDLQSWLLDASARPGAT